MDAVGARRPRSREHRVGVEVGRRRRRPAADLDGLLGEALDATCAAKLLSVALLKLAWTGSLPLTG